MKTTIKKLRVVGVICGCMLISILMGLLMVDDRFTIASAQENTNNTASHSSSYTKDQPKSGTQLAFDYAYQRKRGGKDITIINVYDEDDENDEN